MSGIYLHIPFCKKACHYCNFHFAVSLQQKAQLVAALCTEARLRKTALTTPVATLYFGGGTPSLLTAAELSLIIQTLREHFNILPDAEITLEANPDDCSPENIANWKAVGINRLSIGIQSFFDEHLEWMNRAHTATQADDCIRLAQEAGLNNITIDLIYGTPGLTDAQWKANIQKALDLGIPHLSCYALTVEPRTALDSLIQKGKKENIDTDQQARQFEILTNALEQAGFEHYEISNFARPGFRSRHNSSYWQGLPYLGLGPSAHSYDGHQRQWNIANNGLYISSIERGEIPAESEILSRDQQLNEYIMTSIRTLEGCSLKRVAEQWGTAAATALRERAGKHLARETITLTSDERLVLRPEGKFLADGIAADLFV